MKICAKCGGEKTGTHESYCVTCYNAYKRAWYQQNREKEIARCAAYNKAHPEVPAAAMRRSRAKDPIKARQYTKEWRANNPELASVYDQNKRAKRRAQIDATVDKITPQQWKDIRARYQNHCAYCLKPFSRLSMDHVVPLARGGSHSADNIVPACLPCNTAKNAKDQLQFVSAKFGRLL